MLRIGFITGPNPIPRFAPGPMQPIYLDHAATTPLRAEVLDAMIPVLQQRFGNPSSIHAFGRAARATLDDARARLAAVLGAEHGEIVFTRGGTEADNLAVLGRSLASAGAVVCSATEHRAVLAAAERAAEGGTPLHRIGVDAQGRVDPAALDALLPLRPSIVSVMWANNEVGTVQPIAALADRCRAAGVVFHSDAVQALGKLDVRVDRTPVDLLSVTAHKIGGPRGVGALFVRRGTTLIPLLSGGGQERGLRPGTEDVAGAVGLALAAELAVQERTAQMQRLGALRDRLEHALRAAVPDLVVNGVAAERLPTLSNVSVPGADSELLLPALDVAGLAVSSGSACSSGATRPSHVLTSMGLPAELAGPSIRFALGRDTTEAEVDVAISVFPEVVERVRSMVATF